ncbi:MAG: Uncharacterised protein [Rhodospirillaceae bacterium]|nr:MAG: Uncharacterised protein [Rhodospirillaceae bacterium]
MASARGFMALVAGLRLKHSRSWIDWFSSANACRRANTSVEDCSAVAVAIR